MTTDSIEDIFGPIRDLFLVHYFRMIRAQQIDGTLLSHEPTLRDENGRLARFSQLSLPRRADLVTDRAGQAEFHWVNTQQVLPFHPVRITHPPAIDVSITPCVWNALDIHVDARIDEPFLDAIRYWYLEWFQPRRLTEAPELTGCVHAIKGPIEGMHGACFRIDMGSAPTDAISELLGLFHRMGATTITFASEPGLVEAF